MKGIISMLFILLIIYPAYTQSSQDIISVLPIKCSGFGDDDLSSVITEFTQDALIRYSNYKIVEKSQVEKIIKEQGLQISGLTENAVEVGKLLSSKIVIVGSLMKLGKEITFNLRFVDTENAEILKSEKKSARIELEDINNVLIDPTVKLLTSNQTNLSLNLLIKSAIGVKNMDTFSKSDCWIQVYVGNRLLGRTKHIQDNNSPKFNKQFEITDYNKEIITIKVFDHDMRQNQLIGEVILKQPKSGSYPILFKSKKVKIGTLNRGQLEVVFEK